MVALGLILGGWMTFDGIHALTFGDYITPRTGPSAGQLGPWSRLVAGIGLDPRSRFIKVSHVTLGLFWLAAVFTVITGWKHASLAIGICAVSTLWYAPAGTAIGLIELAIAVWSLSRQTS
jgi:hypothetical protein